ncbi:MAG TPA: glutathione S-transferase family protein [Myxococcaceae bacterium]|nr:glutathione S-transferase family protein [Myxococcaceae bacterium]
MDFYYGRCSGNSARVAFGLIEAGATFQPHLIDTRKGENRSAEYLAVNPMGKIPALVDGELKLWESNAINWYVVEKLKSRLLPASLAARASVQRWLFFQAAHVTPACISVFRATNARVQAFWQTTADPKALEAGRKELARYLPVLEAALANRDWLEGDFSLADIAYGPHFFLVAEGGFDFSPYPRLRAWQHRLEKRPGWKKAQEMIFAG